MIKGSIQKEDITIVNIYAPNIGAPQYIRQILTTIKGEISSNIILDISYRKKTVKNTNTWRLNNMLLNNQEITEEIKEEIKKIPRNKWKWKYYNPKPMGGSKSSSRG